MIYFCCDQNRRDLVRAHPALNGIDRVEVVDRELIGTPQQALRQRRLRLFWLRPPAGPLAAAIAALKPSDVEITGGESITGIRATGLVIQPDHLRIDLDRVGDYSTYTLGFKATLPDVDPRLSRVDFSFKVECPTDLDCQPACGCAPEAQVQPELDYLAKDYASFRQLLLDRLALTTPGWQERNPADLGITLVELLAYVGDHLSYRQDAFATEAYLDTARQRASIRRHARLLDYPMHDGANARTWIHVTLDPSAPAAGVILPRSARLLPTDPWPVPTRFLTVVGDEPVLSADAFRRAIDGGGIEVFEPLMDAELHAAHNELTFHTWSDEQCCLPRGATKATLKGALPRLAAGMVLVLLEQVSPHTGDSADADPVHRHAVRLVRVQPSNDVLTGDAVTEIEWAAADALPFALCISSVAADGRVIPDVSVAWGNILLADHGLTLADEESLGTVPEPNPVLATAGRDDCGHCADESPIMVAPRFRPRLKRSPVTQAGAPPPLAAARDAFLVEPASVLPAVALRDSADNRWAPQRDLLASDGFAREFVLETGNDGRGTLRFGDDENGLRPTTGEAFWASYRVGNGTRGNLGAGSLVRVFAPALLDAATRAPVDPGLIFAVSNPLPAIGGREPETLEEVRQYAPQAFRVPRRCVTPADYAARAGEHPEVQRAAATLRWTGSWHTVFLSVDRRGGRPVDERFESDLRRFIESYRLAGHDLEIDGPRFVPLDVKFVVCVAPGYFSADVKAALLDAFSHRSRPDGSTGFFHPDRFTFGQPVYVSALVATAQAVPGVEHVELTALQRLGTRTDSVPADGELRAGRLEILRLDQDPSFPGRGRLRLEMKGGR
jgi:hypothetical protein